MKFYLEQRTLSDDVAKIIRKMILNGTLKPGERLNQVQLAEQLSISRGPVREAIKLLQNEGLITHETNKGTYVTTLSLKDAYEIYTLRALLESEAAQLAVPNLTEEVFMKLEILLNDFQISYEKQDLEQEACTDILFHKTIVGASKHQRLIHMHGQLDTQVGAMFLTIAHELPQRASKVVENHKVLVEVLKTKNLSNIKQLFSEHYTIALNELSKLKNNQDQGRK